MAAATPSAKLRVGIVGVGKHGSRYARHATNDVEGMELVAVCRRDEDLGAALAGELGCAFEPEAEALIRRKDVDIVVLSTIPSLLPDLLEMAVAEGKRIVLEKPVAPSLNEGISLLPLLEKPGVYCIAGHTLRFNAAVECLRRELPSLGRLDSLLFSQRFPPQIDLSWLDQPEESGGGNILHTGVHCFDLLRWLGACEVSSVAARATAVRTSYTEDHFVASLATDREPLMAQVANSRCTNSRNGLIEASGEHGQVVIDHVLGSAYRLGPGGREDLDPGPARMTVRCLLEQVVADARRDAAPPVTFRDGLAAIAVAEACFRAVESEAWEQVRELPEPP